MDKREEELFLNTSPNWKNQTIEISLTTDALTLGFILICNFAYKVCMVINSNVLVMFNHTGIFANNFSMYPFEYDIFNYKLHEQ